MSKTLSFLIIFLLCFCQIVNADPSNEINSSENFIPGDEESLATVNNCVNVVTGSFFQVDHDLIVDGPEPLRFIRCYDSGHLLVSSYGFGFASQYPLKIDGLWKGKKQQLTESWSWQEKGKERKSRCVAIETQEGSYFRFEEMSHSKKEKTIHFSLDREILKHGLSNYSDHGISAHTNMLNVQAIYTYKEGKRLVNGPFGYWHDDEKEMGDWEVHYPDGSSRKYNSVYTKVSLPGLITERAALLDSIQCPTGNRICFDYQYMMESPRFCNGFSKIYHTNAKGEKLNEIDRIKTAGGYSFQLVGSNGQSVNYQVVLEEQILHTKKNGKEEFLIPILKEVSAPHLPTTKYTTDTSGKKSGSFKIGQVEKPDGHILNIAYNSKGQVKELKAPFGKTSKLLPFYTFEYGSLDRSRGEHRLTRPTTVKNALGTKTIYRIKNKRIKSVESYNGDQMCCSKDFFWEEKKGWIQGKAYRVSDRFVNKAITYRYDRRGNIVEEIFFGNLTGSGSDLFSFDGEVVSGSPESCSTYFTYSKDGFNLKLSEADDFGLKTLYSYQPSTNLLIKELALHHDQIQGRTFHTYDGNAVLIKTIQDNGSSDDANDLTGVTERLITKIIPVNEHLPSLGKPAEIKESYYDQDTRQECLLRCTKCAYSPHGFLTRKDVFDANMTFAYSEIIELHMSQKRELEI